MSLELLFLGTGTSAGVPMIGCKCDVCHSTDPRDQRTRPSVLIRYPIDTPRRGNTNHDATPRGDFTVHPDTVDDTSRSTTSQPRPRPRHHQWLIDTAPEMRSQMIRHQIDHLDGVLYTHSHADHVFGLDDLRRFNAVMEGPLDIYVEPATLERIRAMFSYIFEPHKNVNQSFIATLIPRLINAGVPLQLGTARWTPLRLLHGRLPILGFRVDYPCEELDKDADQPAIDPRTSTADRQPRRGDMPAPKRADETHLITSSSCSLAYCTDVSSIPPETYPLLEDLDILVLDALRYRHHPTHLTVDQALEIIDRLQPRRAYLTHMAHDIRHADLEARLPEHVFLAFDGLALSCATT